MGKDLEVIDVVSLDRNGIEEKENGEEIRWFDDNGGLPEGNYPEDYLKGDWVIIEGRVEIGKDKIIWAYRSIDNTTLIRLGLLNHDSFWLPQYMSEEHPATGEKFTPIPTGVIKPVSVLVRKDGEDLGVNINRKLDGQKFTAVFGMKLNEDIFLGYEGDRWELIDISDLN